MTKDCHSSEALKNIMMQSLCQWNDIYGITIFFEGGGAEISDIFDLLGQGTQERLKVYHLVINW